MSTHSTISSFMSPSSQQGPGFNALLNLDIERVIASTKVTHTNRSTMSCIHRIMMALEHTRA
ncbi:hypothetical protein Pmar_PMAR008575 [Perkinsus marinus ATCC 50983]|uniref:Uncharacterized protein n=1 Tax=Perkinsus marinus (strain ATCC 50983 / TXsc) TaxID=423536 RepID=C5L5J9_PERM5|nr:hypothetical protein Pmar_PMAR008575 [Perkinsus marinus ATCC 50983]EER07991.1 hypothetical protein Pmar_PMAR008575 [Perkinsus marinus ATCC 50983]|eukprot:XP_002776175.1 hypothetical protein Pmar_PMAR008575 [Perkinsus marinus ATCC 50983]